MDQARIEFFLDDGWSLVGRLHLWMSRWPQESKDQIVINDLIRGLQKMWASANDLGTMRLGRTCLALELMLERFCAGSLEFTEERLQDFTAGVGCLQELLLGFEATREELDTADLDAIARIEGHTQEANWASCEENAAVQDSTSLVIAVDASAVELIAVEHDVSAESALDGCTDNASCSIERTLLNMLEQFVLKLDDTCQRLHSRMLSDDAPYVTTTSRLEHLSQVTRELVDQMIRQANIIPPVILDQTTGHCVDILHLDDIVPMFSGENLSVDDVTRIAIPPSTYSVELDQIENELSEMSEMHAIPTDSDLEPMNGFEEPEITPMQGDVFLAEESLFYRHLIGIALESAGYTVQAFDSPIQLLATLERVPEACAILVDGMTPAAMVESLKKCQQRIPIRVIGLKTSAHEQLELAPFDGLVSKAHPQQLIGLVNRIVNPQSVPIRISA